MVHLAREQPNGSGGLEENEIDRQEDNEIVEDKNASNIADRRRGKLVFHELAVHVSHARELPARNGPHWAH